MTMALLTDQDKQIIEEAIRKAEASTSGEIVFALTDASARYHHATLQGAFVGVVLATAIYRALPVEHTIGIMLWTQLVAFAVCYALLPYLPWRRWLIAAREMDARVHEAALMEFYSSGIYRTREENGILIYLSCLERRVVVLGDRGIHQKMGDHHWNEVRDTIIRGIRSRRAREGICEAIERCGKALAEHFPHRLDDVNELSDSVLERKVNPEAP
jgi:putative membrane protein